MRARAQKKNDCKKKKPNRIGCAVIRRTSLEVFQVGLLYIQGLQLSTNSSFIQCTANIVRTHNHPPIQWMCNHTVPLCLALKLFIKHSDECIQQFECIYWFWGVHSIIIVRRIIIHGSHIDIRHASKYKTEMGDESSLASRTSLLLAT